MGSIAIPIHKIRVDSTLSTTVSRSSLFPSPLRKILLLWLFPRVLNYVVRQLSGRLGQLTSEQARELYGPLRQLHSEVEAVLEKRAKQPRIKRFITDGWADRVRLQSDRVGDIVESLAWGSDSELRNYIDEAVEELELPVG
jgi:hypothetical protein